MKNSLYLIIVASLFGCAATNDMHNNQYATTIPSSNISGIWTGNNGPYLMTYKFNGDGTGLSCYSYGSQDVIERFKVNGNLLILQTGLKQTIEVKSENILEMKADYFGGAKFTYKQDNQLAEASPYCQTQLRG